MNPFPGKEDIPDKMEVNTSYLGSTGNRDALFLFHLFINLNESKPR